MNTETITPEAFYVWLINPRGKVPVEYRIADDQPAVGRVCADGTFEIACGSIRHGAPASIQRSLEHLVQPIARHRDRLGEDGQRFANEITQSINGSIPCAACGGSGWVRIDTEEGRRLQARALSIGAVARQWILREQNSLRTMSVFDSVGHGTIPSPLDLFHDHPSAPSGTNHPEGAPYFQQRS